MDTDVARLIERFGLAPIPVEGTLVANTYRHTERTAAGGPIGSAMIGLYCADPPSGSTFHGLAFDEVWHFYAGDPIRLVLLHPDGTSTDVVLGPDVLGGHQVQFVIPAGVWQAGELVAGGRWALFGCTLTPGFTGGCFEGGRASALLASHPDRAADIDRLALPDDHVDRLPDGYAG